MPILPAIKQTLLSPAEAKFLNAALQDVNTDP